jgi:hypothetical protein
MVCLFNNALSRSNCSALEVHDAQITAKTVPNFNILALHYMKNETQEEVWWRHGGSYSGVA